MSRFRKLMAGLLAAVLMLSGCGSSDGDHADRSLRVVFAAPFVNQSEAEGYADTLRARNASLPEIRCTAVSLGDTSQDPTAALASMMKISGMVAGKEIDVILYDIDAAARDARSETFYSMSELFTEEELNEVEEMTPEYGLDISDQAEICKILNSDHVGIFVVGNAQNLDAAKALVRSFLS